MLLKICYCLLLVTGNKADFHINTVPVTLLSSYILLAF